MAKTNTAGFAYTVDTNGHPVHMSYTFHNDALGKTPEPVPVTSQGGVGPCFITYTDCYDPDQTNIAFLKIYDKATTPSVGTDTPIRTIFAPSEGDNPLSYNHPIQINLGLWVACTANAGDSDNTSPNSDMLLDLGIIF